MIEQECEFYIAEEFILPRYKNGEMFRKLHLANLAMRTDKEVLNLDDAVAMSCKFSTWHGHSK